MKPKEDIETIYETALSVFAEFGYQKATMADIAGRLHMTKGNLYRYAENKADLYQNTVSAALRRWQARVSESVEAAGDAKNKFLVMCEKAVEYLAVDTDLRRLLIRDPEIFPMFPTNDPFAEINAASVELIKAILRQGMAEDMFRPIDADRMAEVIFMIYKMFVIRMYIKTDDRFAHEMFEDTVDLFTQGLLNKARAE